LVQARGAGTSNTGLGVVEEVVYPLRRLRRCVESRFRNGHDDRGGEHDHSVILYLDKVPIVFRERPKADPSA
jgi:hypothetical protein